MLNMAGCEGKIKRGEEHLESLKNEVDAWHATDPYTATRRTTADSTRHSVFVEINRQPALERWSLLAGDCVHSLRTALDHCIYSLAVHHADADPPPAERQLQFPIAETPNAFSGTKWRIKHLSKEVQGEIETLQPYNRGHASVPPLLSLLREFDDRDKHRFLNLLMSAAPEGDFRNIRGYALPPGKQVKIESHENALEGRTEIAALITPTPAPHLTYDFALKLVVAVEHAPGPSGATLSNLTALLGLIRDEVRVVIDSVVAKA